MALDTPASNLFFQVISARHDAELGTIATTNLPFGKFNQIFANDAIAHAIVDRLVNEAEVVYMEGDIYRPHQRKEKLKAKKQNAQSPGTQIRGSIGSTVFVDGRGCPVPGTTVAHFKPVILVPMGPVNRRNWPLSKPLLLSKMP